MRFQTEPLDEDLVVAGKIDLELWASTDGSDTDFMVKLVDVYPDGYEALVLDTALRTRYRFGRRAEDVRMMEPNQPEKMVIDMWNTAITIEQGHRLAVHISSSNSPRFETNPNTGDPARRREQATAHCTEHDLPQRRSTDSAGIVGVGITGLMPGSDEPIQRSLPVFAPTALTLTRWSAKPSNPSSTRRFRLRLQPNPKLVVFAAT